MPRERPKEIAKKTKKKRKPTASPLSTSATSWADIRIKGNYNSIICKKDATPKTYTGEKAENYNSGKGTRKTPRKTATAGIKINIIRVSLFFQQEFSILIGLRCSLRVYHFIYKQ